MSGQSIGATQKRGVAGWLTALVVAAVVKFKSVLWLAGSLVTMIVSVAVFAQQDGIAYGVGLVLLILIHECGHWIWMKVMGLNPKAPMFIPGLGAFVAMTTIPSESVRAWAALAGPLIGGFGCAVMFALGMHSHNNWLMTSSNTGFMLNLMQLVPAKPLDGGFVVGAVSRWLLIPGTLILFLLAFSTGSPILYLLAILSLLSWRKSAPQTVQTPIAPVPAAAAGTDPLAATGLAPEAASVGPEPMAATASEQTASLAAKLIPTTGWDRILIGLAYLGLLFALVWGYLISSVEVGL